MASFVRGGIAVERAVTIGVAGRQCSSLANHTTRASFFPCWSSASRSLINSTLFAHNRHVRRLASIKTMASTFSSKAKRGPAVEKVIKVSRAKSPEKVAERPGWKGMIDRFLAPKPMPKRYTVAWYREVILICTVFAITGSSTMILVRPAVKDILGIDGSFKDGPWSYRICSIVIMSPIYATLLVAVGTVFGRHAYFRHFSVKIFSRFGIPPEMLDKNFHQTKKNFRKW